MARNRNESKRWKKSAARNAAARAVPNNARWPTSVSCLIKNPCAGHPPQSESVTDEHGATHALTQAKPAMTEGFSAPSNWARHTFATMHLHGFQDAGKTSL